VPAYDTREWPFLVGFEGRPWPDSIDPLVLAMEYGEEGLLYLATLMSLFTDARAPKDARLPVPDGDRRGWWADAYRIWTLFAADARPRGSLLWLMSRSKDESGNPARVEMYAREALKWMLEAGLATDVSVVAARGQGGAIAVALEIKHKAGGGILLKCADFWEVYRAYHD
jgi:phage gp46-like protein